MALPINTKRVYEAADKTLTISLLGVAGATIFIALFAPRLVKAAWFLYEVLP